MLSRVSRRVMATRHPNHREKYVALGDQDLAGFRSDLLRRRCAAENPLYPAALHKCRLWETWRALLWAPARSRLRRGTRGAPVRERGPAWPVVAVSRDRIPRKKDC